METKHLHNVCLTIKFENDIRSIVKDEFDVQKNREYYGSWEIGEHYYFYEINLRENEMYIQPGIEMELNVCPICDGYLCLFEEIDHIFCMKYVITYH